MILDSCKKDSRKPQIKLKQKKTIDKYGEIQLLLLGAVATEVNLISRYRN